KLRRLRKQALWWMIPTGMSAIYTGWDYLDNKAGEYHFTIDPETGEPTFSPERQRELRQLVSDGEIEEPKVETYPLGEVCYKVFSPFQLLPDENATDFDQITDLITTEVVDVDVLRGMYGRAANDVKPDAPTLGVMERRILARNAAIISQGQGRTLDNANGVLLHTYWLLPNIYYGNGLLKNGICVRW